MRITREFIVGQQQGGGSETRGKEPLFLKSNRRPGIIN